MQVTTYRGMALTLGWFLAALILVLDIVFLATSQIDLKLGLMIGGLAIARLI